jgi:ATP-dependent helicase HrpA
MRNPHRPSTPPRDAIDRLLAGVEECMLLDRHRLRGRLRGLRDSNKGADHFRRVLDAVAADIERSRERVTRRLAGRPEPTFPDELPVSQRRAEIEDAIRNHQVVVVCGETGSGKTTQLPKICLAAGRGVTGLIGHTQPRRIAARAVAARIADEVLDISWMGRVVKTAHEVVVKRNAAKKKTRKTFKKTILSSPDSHILTAI